jgi:quinol monooxygenase YgiN
MTIFVPNAIGPVALVGVARPRPERASELKALLLSFVAPTRAEPGLIHYLLHEDGNGNFVFYERWASAADLNAHLDLSHMRDFQARRMEYLASDLEIEWLRPAE